MMASFILFPDEVCDHSDLRMEEVWVDGQAEDLVGRLNRGREIGVGG